MRPLCIPVAQPYCIHGFLSEASLRQIKILNPLEGNRLFPENKFNCDVNLKHINWTIGGLLRTSENQSLVLKIQRYNRNNQLSQVLRREIRAMNVEKTGSNVYDYNITLNPTINIQRNDFLGINLRQNSQVSLFYEKGRYSGDIYVRQNRKFVDVTDTTRTYLPLISVDFALSKL